MLDTSLLGNRRIVAGADNRDSGQYVVAAEAMIAGAVLDLVVCPDCGLDELRAFATPLERVGDAYEL